MRPYVLVALVPVSLAAQATVSADPLDALVRDSPFAPAAGAPRAPGTGESGPLELRSVVFEGGEYAFSIYDQGSRESHWVKLGQQDLPFVARSFDREQDILTVEYQGRTMPLKLQPAQTAGQAPAGATPTPPPLPSADDAARPGAPRPAAPGQAPSPASLPTPTGLKPEESQRLQNMADEIRRRRMQSAPPPKI